ncbi:Dyp-type peroxidase [Kocuria sp.]|uniref:Dyp-type peroxidase n=1 Tax=Kocuria sp. TaxID=1871328 RepID=UPI0026DD9129|nr:Dyp-type peroxidase [Kocuria sp.]MDO4919000.1 Dyp-type peroxidase [Kocuria sp.]
MPTQKILAAPAKSAMFLVLSINEGAEAQVAEILTGVSDLTKAVSFRVPASDLLCVVGIGSHAWDRLFDAPHPRQLHPFREIAGPTHTAVATPGDLLIHLRAGTQDVCFELAKHLMRRFGPHVTVEDEVQGFKFFEERDLLGFVDGTANPEGEDAVAAALVGDQDPAYRGGSYVVVQKYLHDMAAWEALSTEEQERVIGRSKLEDIEMSDEQKPANSHVALNDLDDVAGHAREIVRDNMPFGRVGSAEFGTYFIGYAADPAVTETMLENMFLGNPPGTHDRILDFSTAVTGGLFFAPPRSFLDDPSTVPAEPPAPSGPSAGTAGDSTADDAAPTTPADGSLGIGSLRRPSNRS